MSTRTERAEKIFLALLARDPLAPQRFTDISERLEQLTHLAFAAAEMFDKVALAWSEKPAEAAGIGKRLWDYSSKEAKDVAIPARLRDAAHLDAKNPFALQP